MRTSNIQHRTSNIEVQALPALPALPAPRVGAIDVRVATMNDLPFLDGLQKLHYKQLGYFPTKQFEGYIEMGAVLVAERCGTADYADDADSEKAGLNSSAQSAKSAVPTPLGYCISRDRYLKRDELGVIFQLCVAPDVQRGLIGASLVKEVFERSAYGCRLYCCWCAQDLAANYFWESLGFVPLAFRGGSGKKKRVHIFWQKRIRQGDETTPWWFPSKTDQGALRADRLVLPIPPGVRWSDPMPVLRSEGTEAPRHEGTKGKKRVKMPEVGSKGGPLPPTPRPRAGVQFGPPTARPVVVEPIATPLSPALSPGPGREEGVEAKPAKVPKQQPKCDPKLISAARELRDRWMEEINAGRYLPVSTGKYDVTRLPVIDATPRRPQHLLPAFPPTVAA